MRLRDFEDPDDDAHTWRDLLIFIRTRGVASNYAMAKLSSEERFWTPDRQLMATIADRLAILIWQPTEDGRKGINQPKPIPRPGVTQDTPNEKVKKKGGKAKARTALDMAKILGWT